MKHLTLILTLLFNSLALFGQYDVLYDSTFNGDGIVILPYVNNTPEGLFLQPDGKMVLLCKKWINNDSSVFTILRLNANGALDGSYNNTGINDVPTLFHKNGRPVGLLMPNNDLVVGNGPSSSALFNSIVFHKYLANGTKDEHFGNAGAVVITIDSFSLGCSDLQVYEDSSILVLISGYSLNGSPPYKKNFLCKLHKNGSVDSSFAVNGILEIPSGLLGAAEKMVLSGDGSIYISGSYYDASGTLACAVIKLNADLTIDNGFHFVSSNFYYGSYCDIGIVEDGKLMVSVCRFDLTFDVYRFMPDGTLDNSFSKDGVLDGYLNFDAGWSIKQTIEQPDGKVLLQLGFGAGAIRVNPNGTLDYTFDLDGIMEKIPAFDYTTFLIENKSSGMALQPDGKMIFVAETETTNLIKVIRLMTRP